MQITASIFVLPDRKSLQEFDTKLTPTVKKKKLTGNNAFGFVLQNLTVYNSHRHNEKNKNKKISVFKRN